MSIQLQYWVCWVPAAQRYKVLTEPNGFVVDYFVLRAEADDSCKVLNADLKASAS